MKRKPTLTIYRNRAGRYNWTLKASNGEPLAKGCGERANGFASARSAWRNLLVVVDALGWLDAYKGHRDLYRLPRKGEVIELDPLGQRSGLRITREAE